MKTTSLLTDLKIQQSETWQKTVDYIDEVHAPLNKLLEPLSRSSLLSPILDAIKFLFLRKRYGVVINGSLRTGQILAFLKKILGLSSPRQIILELMLDEEREAFWWKIKRKVQATVFRNIDLIFVSSRSEVATYSERLHLSKSRIRFLPFHTNVVEPRIMPGRGDYLLSAGKTGRDFDVLVKAVRNLDCKIVIVSDKKSIEGIEIPSNANVLLDIPYSQYLELLFDSWAVIVPLKKLVKSTGQVVVLEAMALGKPVIATETVGTVDYIQSNINGILVPPGDSESIKNAVSRLLKDESFYRQLSANALSAVKEHHTFEIYVDTILKAARELAIE